MSIKFNAPITLVFALVCTAIFFADKTTFGNLMPFFTIQPSINWDNPLSIFTLVGHCLGHMSMEHLLSNLTFILLLGPIIEEKYGSQRLLIMILLTSLVTGLLNILFFKMGLMGASGIVFMMILLVSFTNVKAGQIPITFILVALLFVGKEILKSTETNNIAESAHIIGGMCGAFFGFKWAR
jgi:membrane associated rhomboid family serine protease